MLLIPFFPSHFPNKYKNSLEIKVEKIENAP